MAAFNSILVAVDDSPQSWEALRRGAALARESSAKLALLYVEPAPHGELLFGAQGALRGKDVAPPPEERWCDLASEIRGERVGLHYATGEPGARIVEFARETRSDLIVLGSRARSTPALAIGSCIAKVVVHAPCPVLIVPERSGSASAGA